MKVVRERPPMWDEINAAFRVVGKPIIFTWGDTIYNPAGIVISPELFAHEGEHCRQQAGKPEPWWQVYILSPKFRLDQELPAHRAEFKAFCDRGAGRHDRRAFLCQVAKRLSSPLYGSLISYAAAKKAIAA